jgi:hypothetical protein
MTARGRRLRRALRSSWPAVVGVLLVCSILLPLLAAGSRRDPVDVELTARLQSLGLPGRIESTLTERLGRPLNPRLADTGRLLMERRSHTCPSARRAGVHPADRARGGGRLRLRGRQRRYSRGGRPAAQRFGRVSAPLRPGLPGGARGGADHLRHGRERDRGVRVHAHVRECSHRPLRARQPRGADGGGEDGRAARPRRCRLHELPPGLGPLERDVQRLPRARHRRAATRPGRDEHGLRRPGANEDFGREQFTGDPVDRYAFRTSPLWNVALQPAFMHNGAFTSLEAAIRFHVDVVAAALAYDPRDHGLDADLVSRIAPVEPLLSRLDRLVAAPRKLSQEELETLVVFVRDGLLDPRGRMSCELEEVGGRPATCPGVPRARIRSCRRARRAPAHATGRRRSCAGSGWTPTLTFARSRSTSTVRRAARRGLRQASWRCAASVSSLLPATRSCWRRPAAPGRSPDCCPRTPRCSSPTRDRCARSARRRPRPTGRTPARSPSSVPAGS